MLALMEMTRVRAFVHEKTSPFVSDLFFSGVRQKTGTGTDGSDLSSQPEGHGFEPRFGKSERQASIHSGDKVESLKHVDRN